MWCKELTHLKRSWCWESLKVGGEGDDRGWDGWMASPTQWTRVWVNSGSCWWTERPGMLQSMGSQRVRHNWVALNYKVFPLVPSELFYYFISSIVCSQPGDGKRMDYSLSAEMTCRLYQFILELMIVFPIFLNREATATYKYLLNLRRRPWF